MIYTPLSWYAISSLPLLVPLAVFVCVGMVQEHRKNGAK